MVKAWLLGAVLAVLFGAVIAPRLVPLVVPMSHYYVLEEVYVENAVQGTSPLMLVKRTIVQDHRGWYEIEIERAVGSEFETYYGCGTHVAAETTYRTYRKLPDPLTLNWWMGIPPNQPCDPPPGDYRIITTHYARSWFGAVLSESVPSNVFTIHPVRP